MYLMKIGSNVCYTERLRGNTTRSCTLAAPDSRNLESTNVILISLALPIDYLPLKAEA